MKNRNFFMIYPFLSKSIKTSLYTYKMIIHIDKLGFLISEKTTHEEFCIKFLCPKY